MVMVNPSAETINNRRAKPHRMKQPQKTPTVPRKEHIKLSPLLHRIIPDKSHADNDCHLLRKGSHEYSQSSAP
jgi:hypothetical protein